MSSRRPNMTSFCETTSDSAAQVAIRYLQDFSRQAAVYKLSKSEKSAVLLNRSVSLLGSIQPQHFNPQNLEVAKFFIDMYGAISDFPDDSDALWSCVTLLQHCSRNLEARQAILEDYRFVPLLTVVLKHTQGMDKVQRLLTLLQELTYGIHITWEEPYVKILIEKLVDIIEYAVEHDEEAHGQLALSVLINLCYKNFVVLFLFLRLVNISSFSRRIQNYGILANKMLIVLSQDICSPDTNELHSFLRATFVSVGDCMKQWNVPHLRHVVDFMKDSKAHNGLYSAMLSYPQYCEDIESLLDILDSRATMDDSNEESRKQQHICMGLFFQLIGYIMQLSAIPEAADTKNIISLDKSSPRIFDLICSWVESDVCGVDAVNLLETLIGKKDTFPARIARDPSIVVQLLAITEKADTSAPHTTAILQLLQTLLHQTKTEKLILSKIKESYFDKMLSPLLALKTDSHFCTISQTEIEKSIVCLLLLINFAGIAKKAYFEKCCQLLETPQIQHALARALKSKNKVVCRAVLGVLQFCHLPEMKVAEQICTVNTSYLDAPATPASDNSFSWNATLKMHSSLLNKEMDARLLALIEQISTALKNNRLNDLPTSQLIELYNYKIEKYNSAENFMQRNMECASNEITDITQRINLQNAELQKQNALMLKLQTENESLQTKCKDMEQQNENYKHNVQNLVKKYSEQSESLKISEKRLTVKVSEMIELQRHHNELKGQFETKKEENEKLESLSKENAMRIEKLKKSIASFETDIKEKQRTIEELERELSKTLKAIEEQKEAQKKSDGLITALEAQLLDKNEQIRNYESEITETEELRKTILSLMESKKPKKR